MPSRCVLPLPSLLLFALQFVADGVFYAELNELLTRELASEGYSGVEVRNTPLKLEIVVRATRTQAVLGMPFLGRSLERTVCGVQCVQCAACSVQWVQFPVCRVPCAVCFVS